MNAQNIKPLFGPAPRSTALIVFAVAVSSLAYLNFFVDGFIITLGVMILPVLLYIYDELPAFKVTCLVALASPIFRMLTLIADHHLPYDAFIIIWPEIFFFLSYAFIFTKLFIEPGRPLNRFIPAVFLSDFLSNVLEIVLRVRGFDIGASAVFGLMAIAATRTMMAFVAVLVIRHYKLLLFKEAHESHYHELLLKSSKFWSEIYFMEKNASDLESLMAKSYRLYHQSISENASDSIIEGVLEVTKDIHEVKKQYLQVIKGLEDTVENKLRHLSLGIDEIVNIVIGFFKNKETEDFFEVFIESKTPIVHHFYMTSIIVNLISNALEATESTGSPKIRVRVYEKEGHLKIEIMDNGKGILEKDAPYIFNPGFTSKHSKETGQGQRGIGLSIVKSLTENFFKGSIIHHSQFEKNTTFEISVPIDRLKEE